MGASGGHSEVSEGTTEPAGSRNQAVEHKAGALEAEGPPGQAWGHSGNMNKARQADPEGSRRRGTRRLESQAWSKAWRE